MPQFLTPETYNIDGWEFPQYLSLLKYEQAFLLQNQSRANDQAVQLLEIAQAIATDEGTDLNGAMAILNSGDNEKLLPYAAKIKAATERTGDGDTHAVKMLLRSRLSAGFLKQNAGEIEDLYGFALSEDELTALDDTPKLQRLKEGAVTEQIAEQLIEALPISTLVKMAEFVVMESNGVATPDELPEEEEAEELSPKPKEPDSSQQGKDLTTTEKPSTPRGTGFAA